MTPDNVRLVCGTVLLVSVLASIVALALHGTVTGIEAMAAIGTIITLGGGAFAVHVGVTAGARAALAPPPTSSSSR